MSLLVVVDADGIDIVAEAAVVVVLESLRSLDSAVNDPPVGGLDAFGDPLFFLLNIPLC